MDAKQIISNDKFTIVNKDFSQDFQILPEDFLEDLPVMGMIDSDHFFIKGLVQLLITSDTVWNYTTYDKFYDVGLFLNNYRHETSTRIALVFVLATWKSNGFITLGRHFYI